MKSKRVSKLKEIRPTFFVFCEGETEESYVKYLRSQYKLPVEIVAKKKGSDINTRFINNFKKKAGYSEKICMI
jgi:hypothetical protein